MKKGCALAGVASAVLLSLSGVTRAGFDINYTVEPGTGTLAGKNVFSFYAKNDQQGEQLGSKSLLAMEIHFRAQTPGQAFTFDFRDTDGDAQADANVFGRDFDETNATGTFMRFGSYADWVTVLPAASTFKTTKGANPAQNYASVTDFLVTGFSMNKALDATQGLGRFFGTAVVTAGVDVHVFGQMAAEAGGVSGTGSAAAAVGPIELMAGPAATSALLSAEAAASVTQGPFVPVDVVATAPEPGTLGVVGVGAVAMMAARRRRRW